MSFSTVLALAFIGALPGLAKAGDEKPDTSEKTADKADARPGVTLDAETQERLGLKVESPAPAQWLPVIHATGRVVNPLPFMAAVADYETARTTAAASQAELDRTRKLAAQDNASPRVLEAAQAVAARDALALTAARARFAADWGTQLAAQSNLTAYAESLQTGEASLAKIFLPAGVFPDPLPATASVAVFSRETDLIPAALTDTLNVDPATQVQTLLFSVKQKLPPDVSLMAQLRTAGDAVSGVVVPVDAILRHDGKGWAYVQVETNRFVRAEIPLDRLTAGGWFVSDYLSATNRIVVTGAQSVLSAELSNGGFSTGQRD